MKIKKFTPMTQLVRLGAAAILLSAPSVGFDLFAPGKGGAAFAQSGQGNAGNGGGQAQGGQENQGGNGAGQGGPGPDSDGKGPMAGGPSDNGGGKPAWASEGIPEVELGRLSVARSPDQVLDRALAEALANISPDIVSFYNLSLSDAIDALASNFDAVVMYDSPLQSLSLLRDALDGSSVLSSYGVTNDTDTLMALFIGVASDKTVPVSTNTVIALTTILGAPMAEDEAAALAAAAELVRAAVLAGHG